MNRRWIGLVTAAVVTAAFFSASTAVAAGKKGGGRGKAAYKPVVWLVDSVGPNSCTLTKSDHSELTNLTVAATTQVVVKGQPAKLAEVKAGMRAEFVATGGNLALLTVEDYAPPADEPAKAGKGGRAKKK